MDISPDSAGFWRSFCKSSREEDRRHLEGVRSLRVGWEMVGIDEESMMNIHL
jgi:hypothetical protein